MNQTIFETKIDNYLPDVFSFEVKHSSFENVTRIVVVKTDDKHYFNGLSQEYLYIKVSIFPCNPFLSMQLSWWPEFRPPKFCENEGW